MGAGKRCALAVLGMGMLALLAPARGEITVKPLDRKLKDGVVDAVEVQTTFYRFVFDLSSIKPACVFHEIVAEFRPEGATHAAAEGSAPVFTRPERPEFLDGFVAGAAGAAHARRAGGDDDSPRAERGGGDLPRVCDGLRERTEGDGDVRGGGVRPAYWPGSRLRGCQGFLRLAMNLSYCSTVSKTIVSLLGP